jgi:hypothetical protein
MHNKVRINITIDPTLLDRIDAVCEARNEARSAWFERIASKEIEEEETFITDMENPLIRGFARALVSHPTLLKAVAAAAMTGLTPEQQQQMIKVLPEQANLGAARAARKKGKKS